MVLRPQLAHLWRRGNRGQGDRPVARGREPHRRVRRGAALQLRGKGRCGNRRTEIRRETETLRDLAPAKQARAEAVCAGVLRRGRVAEGDEAGGVRAQRTEAGADASASALSLRGCALAIKERRSHPTTQVLLWVADIMARSPLGEPQVPPDYSVPAWAIVRPYLGRAGGRDTEPHEVSTYAMNMALNAFLADVLNARGLTREAALKSCGGCSTRGSATRCAAGRSPVPWQAEWPATPSLTLATSRGFVEQARDPLC
jgi:hypothetical protein